MLYQTSVTSLWHNCSNNHMEMYQTSYPPSDGDVIVQKGMWSDMAGLYLGRLLPWMRHHERQLDLAASAYRQAHAAQVRLAEDGEEKDWRCVGHACIWTAIARNIWRLIHTHAWHTMPPQQRNFSPLRVISKPQLSAHCDMMYPTDIIEGNLSFWGHFPRIDSFPCLKRVTSYLE